MDTIRKITWRFWADGMVSGLLPGVRRVVTKVVHAKDNLFFGIKDFHVKLHDNIGSVFKLGSTRF